MEAKRVANRIDFSGELSERSNFNAISDAITKARKASPQGRVIVDFSRVKRANSIGIQGWLKVVNTHATEITYVECPIWMVEQFSITSNFLSPHAWVESIRAMFYSPGCDKLEQKTLRIGVDVPLLSDYSNFHFEYLDAGGNLFKPDFEPIAYFRFIVRHLKHFKKRPIK